MPKTKNKKEHRLPQPSTMEGLELKQMSDITWRIFRIMSEFVEGFQFLSEYRKEVTIFGSTRVKPNTIWYKEAERMGQALAKEGYTVITGGGPGIMEAANKGAYSVNPKRSVGINIQLPSEQRTNPFVGGSKGFYYFFTRKVMLAASAQTYVFFPGGFGTMDEFFEMIMLIQTKKAQKIPVIIFGRKYYQPLLDWIDNVMLKEMGAISTKDRDIYHVVDSVDEAMKIVRKSKERSIF